MTNLPTPLLPGFNPDPSVVLVDGTYVLVTSSFEYLPALPIYASTDLIAWTHIGHVATRPEQVGLENVPTPGGVWAPTIRHHDGLFHVIVTVFLGGRGCVVFTSPSPAGPWSDGVVLDGIDGIDPDLAWSDDGTAYVTYAAFGRGILQARVDLTSGSLLEVPRIVWTGTGLLAPEGPHLYRRDDHWYLLIAEGGTDRGHTVSIARGPRPEGPFEGFRGNPFLSARSTAHPIQNLGHADLVKAPDGGTALVLLGVRPVDAALGFSPLGRETFATRVEWVDGWPVAALPAPTDSTLAEHLVFELTDPHALEDPRWIAVRSLPTAVGQCGHDGLRVTADADGLTGMHPAFVGMRQRHHDASFDALVDVSAGTGGVAARLREDHVVAIEAFDDGERIVVTARAVLSALEHTWTTQIRRGLARLRLQMRTLPVDLSSGQLGGERIVLSVEIEGASTVLAELDGRYWSYESAQAFTGRVVGLYAERGTVRFLDAVYDGAASAHVVDPSLSANV